MGRLAFSGAETPMVETFLLMLTIVLLRRMLRVRVSLSAVSVRLSH